MEIRDMLARLTELDGGKKLVTESAGTFKDQVRGTEKAKKIPGGVLGNQQDAKHPFQGRLVGSNEACDVSDEQMVNELTVNIVREFTEFLKEAKRKPLKPEPKDPEKRKALRKKQGRCIDCGESISTAGRGTGDCCKKCSSDDE